MTARYCSLAQQSAPAFAPGLAAERLSALMSGRRMWVNGTVLHYCFFDGDTDASVIWDPETGTARRVSWVGAKDQRDVVRECFQEWQNVGIGLSFVEVSDRSEAELRIGFHQMTAVGQKQVAKIGSGAGRDDRPYKAIADEQR